MDKKIEFLLLNAVSKDGNIKFLRKQGLKPLHLSKFIEELKTSNLLVDSNSGLSLSPLGVEVLDSLKKELSASSENNLLILPAFGEIIDKISINDIYLPSADDVHLLD